MCIRDRLTIRHANFSTWTTDLNVNANVYVILLVAGILISALPVSYTHLVFMVLGCQTD